MVVTDDEALADAVRMLRNYGQRQKYHHLIQGFNRRLDTLQAAILRVKLKYLEEANAARRRHARLYGQLLADSPVVTPAVSAYAEHVYHLYVVRVENRDGLNAILHDRGIATGIHYPVPIHLQPAYQDLGYVRGDFPITEQYAEQVLSLPMYPELEREAIVYVANMIKDSVGEFAAEAYVSETVPEGQVALCFCGSEF
jgi:dTDP-4-amino-4,6-dideoxygalactose transaminase